MSDEQVISATLAEGTYDVIVRPGLLDDLGPRLNKLAPTKRAAIVADSNVAPLYLGRVRQSLQNAGIEAIEVVIPAGEPHKSLDTLRLVYDALLPAKIERSTPLIGLGGGVTTDLAGFAAATLLRGLPYIPVPTSLLAMVDASVGGKTGVNHAAGKNLIGSFHMPAAVFVDPATLSTLPERELRGGLAECVKHDVIRDAAHFETMEREAASYREGDVKTLAVLVAHNVRIKAAVVKADPFEQGERAHLNLGHTFGHAFEKATNYAMSHGEAVAVGTVCACRTSARLGMMSEDEALRVEQLIAAVGLPTGNVPATVEAILPAMQSDKKVRGGRVRFVLPTRIGAATVRDDVPDDLVREVVAGVLA